MWSLIFIWSLHGVWDRKFLQIDFWSHNTIEMATRPINGKHFKILQWADCNDIWHLGLRSIIVFFFNLYPCVDIGIH